jgi:hypothetical protein
VLVPVATKLEVIGKAQWSDLSDPTGLGVIASAREVYYECFRPHLGELLGAATTVSGGDDLLLARWKVDQSSEVREVLLWDEPTFTSFLLRIDPQVLRDPVHLRQLMEGLMVWAAVDRYQLREDPPRPIPIQLAQEGNTGAASGTAWFFEAPAQLNGGVRDASTLEVYGTGRDAYLDFTFSRRIVQHHYAADMNWIAERFPPLRERLPKWTTSQLLAAAGNRGRVANLFEAPHIRDGLLVRELLQRHLTPEESAAFLIHPPQSQDDPTLVIRAGIEAGQAKGIESAIRDLLRQIDQGRTWPGPYTGPFAMVLDSMKNAPEVDLSPDVLAHLKSTELPDFPIGYPEISYLQDHIQRPEDYRAFRDLTLPEYLRQFQAQALETIRVRLHL